MTTKDLERKLGYDCRRLNELRPVHSPTRHEPTNCTPCAESLDERTKDELREQIYEFQPTDFIPVVGLVKYSNRTDLDSDNPLRSNIDGILGNLILWTYNAGIGAGLWYLFS